MRQAQPDSRLLSEAAPDGIMIMRFRLANIRLINRRSILPRLLLALPSKDEKSKNNNKNHPHRLCRG